MWSNKLVIHIRALLIMIFLLSIYADLGAQTEVSGNISGIWDSEGSPYYIIEEIHVPSESSLIILPGCSIVFQGHYKFGVDEGAIFKALGTESDSIFFTAEDTAIGHYSLRFFNTAPGCSIQFCHIEYGKGAWHGGAIYCRNSDVTVINSCITKNSAFYGSAMYLLESNSLIEDNVITANYAYEDGAGIYCDNSQPVIINNQFLFNSAVGSGGAIRCYYSDAEIESNIMDNNSAKNGAGIDCYRSNASIFFNIISNNSARIHGGGVYCSHSETNISENEINFNSADSGGGIYAGNADPIITNNILIEDSARYGGGICCHNVNSSISDNYIYLCRADYGGGIWVNNSSPIIKNNYISSNSAISGGGINCAFYSCGIITNNRICYNLTESGGGIDCYLSNPNIFNNLVYGNTSNLIGGGITCFTASPTISNNTIYNNISQAGGGIYALEASYPVIFNNILWQNSADVGADLCVKSWFVYTQPCTVFVSHNNIDSGACFVSPDTGRIIWGVGNISGNPYFEDSLFHLTDSSTCIDAGAEMIITPWYETIFASTEDFEGGTRPFGSGWDIGADEYGTDIVLDDDAPKPEEFFIYGYPNPFNTVVTISIKHLTRNPLKLDYGSTLLIIYDLLGNEVANLSSQASFLNNRGEANVRWDGRDNDGDKLNSGIYFARLSIGKNEKTVKFLLIK